MTSEILKQESNPNVRVNVLAVSADFKKQFAMFELEINNPEPQEFYTYDRKGKYLEKDTEEIIVWNFSGESLPISNPAATVHAMGGNVKNQFCVATIHKNSSGFINESNKDEYDKTLKGKFEKLVKIYEEGTIGKKKWSNAVLFCYMGQIDACDHITNYSEELTQLIEKLEGKFCIAVKSSSSKIVEDTFKTKEGKLGGSRYRLLSSSKDLEQLNGAEAVQLFEKGIDVIDSNLSFQSYWNLAFGTLIHKKSSTTKYPVYFNDNVLNFMPRTSPIGEFWFMSDSTEISISNTEKSLNISTRNEENMYCMMIVQIQPGSLKMTHDPRNKAHELINNISRLNTLTNSEMIKILETSQHEVKEAFETNFTDNFEILHKQAVEKIVSKFYDKVVAKLNTFIEGTRKRKNEETNAEIPKLKRAEHIDPVQTPMRAQSFYPLFE